MQVYIARQPIFNREKKTLFYELLYRDSEKNAFPQHTDHSASTKSIISAALSSFDFEALTNGRKAFVNFTRDNIMQQTLSLLDPKNFVVEILEDIELDESFVTRVKTLKDIGFTFALDDYVGDPLSVEALDAVDLIKVDFRLTNKETQKLIADTIRPLNKQLLAEKVETAEEFEYACNLGYDLFQGYYFSAPIMLETKGMNVASSTHVKLFKELSSKNLSFDKVASIIHHDSALTYKLLKKMSTTQYYYGHKISSIKQAVVRMGIKELRRWGLLILIGNVAGKESDQMVRLALVRAVFCETMMRLIQKNELADNAFSVGMFSIFNSTGNDADELFSELNINPQVKSVLLKTGDYKDDILYNTLKLITSYESGDWETVGNISATCFSDVLPNILSAAYVDSVKYADLALAAK